MEFRSRNLSNDKLKYRHFTHYMIRIALCFFERLTNPIHATVLQHCNSLLQTLSVALRVFSITLFRCCVVNEVGTNRFYTSSPVRGLAFPNGAVELRDGLMGLLVACEAL